MVPSGPYPLAQGAKVTDQLRERLDQIVRQRQSQVPWVQDRLDRLRDVEEALQGVLAAADAAPPDWSSDPIVRDALERLRDGQILRTISAARGILESLRARFA